MASRNAQTSLLSQLSFPATCALWIPSSTEESCACNYAVNVCQFAYKVALSFRKDARGHQTQMDLVSAAVLAGYYFFCLPLVGRMAFHEVTLVSARIVARLYDSY